MSSKKNPDAVTVAELRQQLESIVGDSSKPRFHLAYSGGIDSQVLLHLLSDLRRKFDLNLHAIHVNHGLHANARSWAQFCQQTCDQLDVKLTIEQVTVQGNGQGPEAAARMARYQALEKHVVSSNDVLLTAHHLNDQAETLLLHLVRGAGINGLAAMPRKKPFAGGCLVRPLLDFSRRRIEAYADAHQLQWIEDQSNADPGVRRSYMRLEILPRLVNLWPGAIRAIAKTAGHMAEADLLLEQLAAADLEGCRPSAKDRLLLSRLASLPPERARNLVRWWIRWAGMRSPGSRQIDEICRLILSPPKTASAEVAWGENRLLIYRDEMVLAPRPAAAGHGLGSEAGLQWNLDRERTTFLGRYRLHAEEATGIGLNRERAGSLLVLRHRQGGERCRLPGRAHRSSLKNLFQEAGIPPWERTELPLIYVGDDLAAIGDRWICEPFQAIKGEPSWKLEVSETRQNSRQNDLTC